jgi:two-component system NtrC family sensor kinase
MSEALLGVIEQSGQRIHRIVNAFRMMTRQGEDQLQLQEVRLDETIDAVLAVLEYRRPVAVTVHRRFEWNNPVLCFPDLLGQVVMNLVANALDVVSREAGNVWITTEGSDTHVRIRIRDDGPGVPQGLRERVFTPFFTTKPPGSGTGLGLALCREIMTQHHGAIELAPATDRGAEFIVSLPRIKGGDGSTRVQNGS